MIRHKLGRLVQWKEGDAHMVGQVVENPMVIRIEYPVFPSLSMERHIMIALAHTHELVSVEASKLSDYPSSPIPEPTK